MTPRPRVQRAVPESQRSTTLPSASLTRPDTRIVPAAPVLPTCPFNTTSKSKSNFSPARVSYPPLCEMSDLQLEEFQEALLDADTFENLPGKWQAAIVRAEENRPKR
jgi:hypothetical protein